MDGLLLSIAEWLDAIGIGPWSREGALTYPIANTLHLLGLVMLVGGIGVFDLRVLGLWKRLPLEALGRALTPVAVAGFVIMVPTGIILFAADGIALATSDTFERKLVLIGIALANAAAFRGLFDKRLCDWAGTAPPAARIMAALSILLWLTIGTLGRFIAYS